MKRREAVAAGVRVRADGVTEIYDKATGKVAFEIEARNDRALPGWQKGSTDIDAAFDRSTYLDPHAGLQ